MSIFYKANGSSNFGLFFMRFFVGLFFFIAGIEKISNLEKYVHHVKAFQVLSDNLAFIIGFTLPFFELVFGFLLILGLFTPVSSFILALINLGALIANGFFPEDFPFNFHLVFFACSVALLIAGAGSFSIDVFLDKKKGRVITVSPDAVKDNSKPEVKEADFTNIKG